MSAFFNKVFKGRDNAGSSKKSAQANLQETQPVHEEDPWLRTKVDLGDIQELLRACTKEIKSRGLSTPFLLLPFRPTSDPGSARNFIRSFFNGGSARLTGMHLEKELRLTDPMVLCSVLKWCWSRLPGGVVSWETYELFHVGEAHSQMARDAFATFIPISVDVEARAKIIFDFFDLLSAIAANSKTNGLAGLKLSRLAGWWAFEHSDSGWGFEGGYKSWTRAADATMHLFFAYLRSLSPTDPGKGAGAVPMLPTSLRALLASVDYPPKQFQLQSQSVKVVMTVETVSPTPFALLRRAKNFQFRDDDKALQMFTQAEDPIQVLTEECKRVLRCISAINESASSSFPTSNGGQSWSRFQDLGFSGLVEEEEEPVAPPEPTGTSASGESFGESFRKRAEMGPSHRTGEILARPTTPSWADFMITGFSDADPTKKTAAPLLLPPDKVLPPIDTTSSRVRSSQSNRKHIEDTLDPGELASVTPMNIDDAFWWVWMTSLANEEPNNRKAVFGRCALAETKIEEGRWLVIEEKVKGAAPAPEDGAYIATKKDKSKRGRIKLGRRKSVDRANIAPKVVPGVGPPPEPARPNISPDAAARVQSVAAALRQQSQRKNADGASGGAMLRPNSVFTLQPIIMSEATPAMKWASAYDKDRNDRDVIRDAYLKGAPLPPRPEERSLPALPKEAEKVDSKPAPAPAPPAPIAKQNTVPVPPKTQVIPSTPESKRPSSPSAQQTATSPKSVQSSIGSVTAPEKVKKSVGSRLGKLFGRKSSDIGASSSRSNTPEPTRATEKPVQKRGPPLVDTDGNNGTANGAKSPIAEKTTLPPIPPAELARESTSHLPGNEERTSHKLNSAFFQGPLTDMPAFVPADSSESSIMNEPTMPETIIEETNPITPTTSGQVPDASPTSPTSPVVDRWAQIRKNAAERAKKMSDDYPSTDTRSTSVDDGDTSGEETIESRVARIKARVAELTGNLDSPAKP